MEEKEIEVNRLLVEVLLNNSFKLYYGAQDLARIFDMNEYYMRDLLKEMYFAGLARPRNGNSNTSKLHLVALPYQVDQFIKSKEQY